MDTGPGDVTKLLEAARNGDTQASNELWAHVLPELRNQAAALLVHERSSADLQVTLMVNEVFVKLNAGNDGAANFEDRGHFFGCAWRCMRQILIDHARARNRQKRGGDFKRIPLEIVAGGLETIDHDPDQLEALVAALDRLKEKSPREHEVLWRRWAIGQSVADVAAAMEISVRTVAEDWRSARSWLWAEMENESDPP